MSRQEYQEEIDEGLQLYEEELQERNQPKCRSCMTREDELRECGSYLTKEGYCDNCDSVFRSIREIKLEEDMEEFRKRFERLS